MCFPVSSPRETGSFSRLKNALVEHVFYSPKELLKLSVPSVVYGLQNNMAFVALSNLDAAVYQVATWIHFLIYFIKYFTLEKSTATLCLKESLLPFLWIGINTQLFDPSCVVLFRWPISWRSRARPCARCSCWTAPWAGCSGSLSSCSAEASHSYSGGRLKPLKFRYGWCIIIVYVKDPAWYYPVAHVYVPPPPPPDRAKSFTWLHRHRHRCHLLWICR